MTTNEKKMTEMLIFDVCQPYRTGTQPW